MKFTRFLSKKLADLLNDRRIVVWYDAEADFKSFAADSNAPNCEVLSAVASVLKTRRRADEVYRLMNESENSVERDRCLLIYIPRRRGATEDEKMRDPFEVYAMAGATFGDTEDQKMESLARQAMPEKAAEITRLFSEGHPTIALLDALDKAQHWPLLQEIFHTESPADILALALCDLAKAESVDKTPGGLAELLRLLEGSIGFKPETKPRRWNLLKEKAAEYVLFSEFAFDLPGNVSGALEAVPRAAEAVRDTIFAACARMRSDSGLSEAYIEAAQRSEKDLRLPESTESGSDLGGHDTFPFEERRLLTRAADRIIESDLPGAIAIFEGRRHSIWRHDPQRSVAWTVLERAVALLGSAARVSTELSDKCNLGELVKLYTSGGWADLDRDQRLFETALTACTDEEALAPIVDLCRREYRDTALRLQDVFFAGIRAEGWPPEGVARQTRIFDEHVAPVLERREKIAFFLVDSLRYEMGVDLAETLVKTGATETTSAAAVVPTVTAAGMAALMPGADGMLRLVKKDGGVVPMLGKRVLKSSSDRMKLLAEIYGDRLFEITLDDLLGSTKKLSAKLKNIDLLVVRTQDPDLIAENLGAWRARRYISDVVGDIASAVKSVVSIGFSRVVISSDHGHMMFPEIPAGDVVSGPPGGWLENKRRCLLGAGLSAGPGAITLKAGHLGVHGDVEEVCLPLGYKVFTGGDGYFHGGLSLQEAIIPVVTLRAGLSPADDSGKPEIDIRYRSDRFTSRVIGLKFHLRGDMFGTSARVRVEAYDTSSQKPRLVGEAADCEARDEKTREVRLEANQETPVPVLLDPDFDGDEVEIRVSETRTRVVLARLKLKNAMLE